VIYRIVGEDEADPTHGTLSYVSPLAQAIMGRTIGDAVTVGPTEAQVVAIA
jgi:transcription elongation GreA/GreB family factor